MAPSNPPASSAARAACSLSGRPSLRTLYIGTPCAPRAVISLASASSAARRAASLPIITTAATFEPIGCRGAASGAFHVDTKPVVAQAEQSAADRIVNAHVCFSRLMDLLG